MLHTLSLESNPVLGRRRIADVCIKMKNKKIPLSEQFQNPIEKSLKEANYKRYT